MEFRGLNFNLGQKDRTAMSPSKEGLLCLELAGGPGHSVRKVLKELTAPVLAVTGYYHLPGQGRQRCRRQGSFRALPSDGQAFGAGSTLYVRCAVRCGTPSHVWLLTGGQSKPISHSLNVISHRGCWLLALGS